MSKEIYDNFDYLGPKPNFVRDSIDTLEELSNVPMGAYDYGHIVYCYETNNLYVFTDQSSLEGIGNFIELRLFINAAHNKVTSFDTYSDMMNIINNSGRYQLGDILFVVENKTHYTISEIKIANGNFVLKVTVLKDFLNGGATTPTDV